VSALQHPSRLGRYEVISLLAQGGMAELFLAKLPGIQGFAKRVVIKRVLPNLARDREFIEMFLEEARLAASLQHQNIVQVQDIGHDESGYFFAMEYLHGADVGELLRVRDGALPMPIALEVARGACAGLQYAHDRRSPEGKPLGIVHRDVSPQNLFVTFDGNVKLLDFGIAKAVQSIASHYTRSGTLRGKLPYMSPEQCQGERIDARSDVFSLAVVLWEMTVGQRLYGASASSDFDVLKAIVERDAPRPSTIVASYPPALEAIVMRGLARDRNARYQSADAMQVELEGFIRASGAWVTAREVAAFLKSEFADRAAASARLEVSEVEQAAQGDILPFPRATRPIVTSETVDLPLPARSPTPPAPQPPSPQPPSPHSATPQPTPPRRVHPLVLVAGAIGIAGAALVIGYAIRGGQPAATKPPATQPPATAPGITPAPRTNDTEDQHWFVDGDYIIIGRDQLNPGNTDGGSVAKLLVPPDKVGWATFLTGDGREIKTKFYWRTHIPKPEELVVGGIGFCFGNYNVREATPPDTKLASRAGDWWVGRITDTADLPSGKIMLGPISCELGAVRIPDR
jgi:serine/threonine protein kinase